MAHDHTHAHGHDHGHHGHGHTPGHFRSCTHPDTCFCEVKRYLLAGSAGVVAATAENWLSRNWAGSFGPEADSLHAFGDSLFFYVSAALALWKRADRKNSRAIDNFGAWVNNLFFMAAGLYGLYRLGFGEILVAFIGYRMFIAGGVGLGGNVAQFVLLGEESDSAMHFSNWLHILGDVLFSVTVMVAALVTICMSLPLHVGWQSAMSAVLVGTIAYLPIRFLKMDSWKPAYQLLYLTFASALVVGTVVLVINGSTRDVDHAAAALLYAAMIAGGGWGLARLVFR